MSFQLNFVLSVEFLLKSFSMPSVAGISNSGCVWD